MITRYEEYLKEPKSLSFEEMLALHREIIEEIESDEDAMELYDELLEASNRYITFRAQWLLLDRPGKMFIDADRTSAHNSVITHFNMLQRYLKQTGKAAKWREVLGYEEDDPYYRRRLGDFACFLVFINSLNAR